MKALIDLNVLLDVIQRREPHYDASARVLSLVASGALEAAIPGHAVTTIHYVVQRYAAKDLADQAVDWILSDFEIAAADRSVMLRARSLALGDFEDAVVAAAAENLRCSWIVTRNVADFTSSPVPAVTPAELLEALQPS